MTIHNPISGNAPALPEIRSLSDVQADLVIATSHVLALLRGAVHMFDSDLRNSAISCTEMALEQAKLIDNLVDELEAIDSKRFQHDLAQGVTKGRL